MATEENKKSARRLVIHGINSGNMAVIDEHISPNVVPHTLPLGFPPTREGLKSFITGFRAAFPDLHYGIEDELVDGDKVVHRLKGAGTMKGDFQGMRASGKKATWHEMHIGRFDANGRIVEHWGIMDIMSMMTQLGFGPK